MNQFERNKKSKELTDTFVSLYDPNLSPLSCLRTTRGLMNTFITLFQDITDTLESHLELIHPKQTGTYDSYIDHFNFLKAFYKTLRKTNIKLAFTPSKVPPKEYDNFGVLYYRGQDIEKEDPMIVENADDFIFTPTLNSENKDPLPQAEKKTPRKRYEDMLISIIHHALRCGDIKKEYTNSEDDMYGLNADDKMYGLSADDKVDPIKLDEDWVSNVKEYLKDKERKVSHPDEDLLIRITKLIFEWCETADIDPSSAKYHILAELYSMMRRFVMLKTSEEKKENKNQTSDEKENTEEKEDEMPILEKLYRASRNPTIFMSNEKLFELFPVDDRIEFLQDEIRSYCCKLNKEDEEDKEDYYKYLLNIYKSIKKREKETNE